MLPLRAVSEERRLPKERSVFRREDILGAAFPKNEGKSTISLQATGGLPHAHGQSLEDIEIF